MINQFLHSFIPKTRRSRLNLTAVAGLAFILLFILLYPRYSTEIVPLVIVPVVVGAWALTWRDALINTLILIFVIFSTNSFMVGPELAARELFSLGVLVTFLTLLSVGLMRDLIIRLQEQSRLLDEERAALEREVVERKQVEAALRAQKQLFENLVAVARATVRNPSLEETLGNALQVSLQISGAESGGLSLRGKENNISTYAVADSAAISLQFTPVLKRALAEGVEAWVIARQEPLLVADIAREARWDLPGVPEHPLGAVISVPIVQGTAVTGVVTLLHRQAGHFTPETLKLMVAAVDQMTLALNNARIFDAQQRLVGQQTTLYETLRAVSGHTDPELVARQAAKTIMRFAAWPSVNVAVLLPGKELWRIISHQGAVTAPESTQVLMAGEGIISRALRTGTLQHIPEIDRERDSRLYTAGICCELALPFFHSGQIIGVLHIQSTAPNAFGSDDLQLAQSLAEVISLAMNTARLFKSISEEHGRLQAIIESSRDGLLMLGESAHIMVINEPALQMLRLPGAPADWRGSHVNQIPLTAPAPFLTNPAAPENETGNVKPRELQIGGATLRWQNLPVLAGDTSLGRLIVLHDVTRERALETLRTDLTRTMVHDLRNPLTSIMVSLQILEKIAASDPSSIQARTVNRAFNSSQMMLMLINAILDISKLESGNMPLNVQSFSFTRMVQEQLELEMPLAADRKIKLINRLAADLPLVRGDPELVKRVLQNLIGNALKFTPAGGAVTITARRTHNAGNSHLQIDIRDTGTGIPADIQPQLFNKFVTGDQEERGSGLGLAYCKLVLEAHGQRIQAVNGPDGGAIFSFSLAVTDTKP